MLSVSCDDVRLGAHCDGVVVGDAAAHPGFGIQVPKQVDGRTANAVEFINEVLQRYVGVMCMLNPWILIETGQRGGVITREDESAVRKDALGIDDVSHKLLHGPLAGR